MLYSSALCSHVPIQQTHIDLQSAPQKLSKIETLRLARNYIAAMSQTLKEGLPMDTRRFVAILSQELSQTTANLLAGTLGANSFYKRPSYPGENNSLNDQDYWIECNKQYVENGSYSMWCNNDCRFNDSYCGYHRYLQSGDASYNYWKYEVNNKYWRANDW